MYVLYTVPINSNDLCPNPHKYLDTIVSGGNMLSM